MLSMFADVKRFLVITVQLSYNNVIFNEIQQILNSHLTSLCHFWQAIFCTAYKIAFSFSNFEFYLCLLMSVSMGAIFK